MRPQPQRANSLFMGSAHRGCASAIRELVRRNKFVHFIHNDSVPVEHFEARASVNVALSQTFPQMLEHPKIPLIVFQPVMRADFDAWVYHFLITLRRKEALRR